MSHKNIEDYLHETLGLDVKVKSWAGKSVLPFFLHDAYEFASIELFGGRYVLMVGRDVAASAAKVRKDLDALQQACGEIAIFVTAVLSSYERKRLVGQHVPFIVPGNQLYLPDLGIDLREYFRQRRKSAERFLSPATQALLIGALLKPWKAEVRPAELAESLGYTSMTVSRAVHELKTAELASVVGMGRERWLRFEDNTQAVWTKALPLLRNPVKQSIWAMPNAAILKLARLAGESALAQATLLADPPHPVYAISSKLWKHAEALGIEVLPMPEKGAYQWQIWRYDPNISLVSGIVDPFSLVLSLRNSADERVQQALSEFEKGRAL